MRTVLVVVGFVFTQDSKQVTLMPDQRPGEDFPAATADSTFHDRIRSWRLNRATNSADARVSKHRVPCGSELRVSITKEKLHCLGVVTQVHQQVPSLLRHPGIVRMSSDTKIRIRRVACSITAST